MATHSGEHRVACWDAETGFEARAEELGPYAKRVRNQFHIEVRGDDHSAVLAVSGELDLASSPALEQELDRVEHSGVELVILDLRELTFMDSTGLSVLVRAHQRAHDTAHRFALVRGTPQVQRLLSLTGVADRLTIVDAPEELAGQAGSAR